MSHHDVCGLDLLLLALSAAHRLLEFHRPKNPRGRCLNSFFIYQYFIAYSPSDFPADAKVEEDETAVGEQLGQEGLAHEIVVHDVELD